MPPPDFPSPTSSQAVSLSQKNARNNQYDMLSSPPVPPPRTSSAHQSRRSPNGDKAGSRPSKSRSDRKDNRERPREDRNGKTRSRRPAPGEDSTRESGRSREQYSESTSQMQSGMEDSSGPELAREPSTVINSVLVSDPMVDREREQVRQVGGVPAAAMADEPTMSAYGPDAAEDGNRAGYRSRHDYSNNGKDLKRKETTFGTYILGQTLGEGEFGKVKLGWKRDGSIQVAIKLIRRETLGSNPNRLPKIYREISILRDLAHPNIVRLHEMVETDRHIGIIMEYASGGELFDYILNNRYLKDNSARRLFAQLVSGVGYLHKKGIVHRDLKLENLLLDRNRNIIITDFGFANTFNPVDQLEEEIEYNLTNKEYVKRKRLDKLGPDGYRRGDLMQTSCGSPCYAAPELVVSDSLYTGRKVDVWSCGVILYAMLAGYLPFDDDPANPDGDNINLLYKYIVTTPLTFPEYVTPHARDLLRRILVPDPRKRADLFEVARHSWLSEYSHIVSHITSSTTDVADIANTTVPTETKVQSPPTLARSASVREPPKTSHGPVPAVGGLNHQAGDISQGSPSDKSKASRDTKRRTVQVEYVAPQSQTARGELQELPESQAREADAEASQPPAPPAKDYPVRTTAKPPVSYDKPLPGHFPRSTSDTSAFTGTHTTATAGFSSARPTTGASMASFHTGRLPSRGSYGQPVAPTVTATNTEGRLAQPKSGQFALGPNPVQPPTSTMGRPSTQQLPPAFNPTPRQEPPKGHKRSNTVSSLGEKLFGRSGSILGSRNSPNANSRADRQNKRYPPTSMKDPMPRDDSRASMDSRRSMQYSHGRKASQAGDGRARRFSLLPSSFSFRTFSSSRDQTPDEVSQTPRTAGSVSQQYPSAMMSQARPQPTPYGTDDGMRSVSEGPLDDNQNHHDPQPLSYEAQIDQQFADLGNHFDQPQGSFGAISTEPRYNHSDQSRPSRNYTHSSRPTYYDDYNNGNNTYDNVPRQSMQAGRRGPNVLQKSHRKFADAYEYERDGSHHSGSSGPARKVMDFFRRRAKSRAGE
ncbi:Serine/threonine-protein kinase KIN4 [Penicillium ucsense]|uniref:non-specific serine/threonine protein kinase n=1 Tax=Penicillium ucsense TaxID=2839758 RepID=A0A8J8W7J2_9EURO|nr:Serine/threonine-protein kinase KIN4 [Penicillium ucsense]KAF7739247.1 Serine/threonine-protein kinase KIN4 [Penicillium ucsense]